VKPWNLVQAARTPEGAEISVYQRDKEFSLRVDGKVLMGSRAQGSEIQLAERTLQGLQEAAAPRILVGGLGFGYTLRAALDCLPPSAQVLVVELMEFVIDLNRGALAELAGSPLSDTRVTVLSADVVQHVKRTSDVYDAILLDVDNGPQAFSREGNSWLYRQPGLIQLYRHLQPGGVLGVWSVAQDDAFTGQLRASGFEVEVHPARSRASGKGERHWIWLARRPAV
jgi:spermidine synthase